MRIGLCSLAFVPLLGVAAPEAGPEGSGPSSNPFPDREQLESLGQAPAISDLLTIPSLSVAEWKLTGPLPDTAGATPHVTSNASEKLLDVAVSRRAGLATSTEPMHCAAREIGLFALAHDALPDSGLVEFIAARCGSTGSGVRPAYLSERVPAAVSDEQVNERWRDRLEEMLSASLQGGPVEIGLWFGRDGDRAVAIVASSQRTALIEPFSTLSEGGAVTIRGEVLSPTAAVSALVNRGRFGFAACTSEPGRGLPRFSFRCELAPDDPQAAIEISVLPVGRFLTSSALRTLARPPGSRADTYRRVEPSSGVAPLDPAELAGAIQGGINAVRRRAELSPLTLSKTQSEDAAELVPHLFASGWGMTSAAVGDLVALGLVAGWRVGGPIKDADMVTGLMLGSRDVGLWLDTVLRYPSGRSALLSPRASVLAVGAISSETPPILAAVATTYELFGEEDFQADARRVLDLIAKARPTDSKPLAELPEEARKAVQEVARAAREEKLSPRAALDRAVERSGQALGRRIQGWVLQTSSLEEIRLPPELLGLESPALAVGVTFTQPDDAPWARYLVLVVAAEPDVSI